MAVTSLSANSIKEILFNLQMQFKQKGVTSSKSLLKNFLQADADQSGYLNRDEFESLLSKSGIFLSKMDINYLMRHFDTNKDKKISFNEFYDTLIPPLSGRRLSLVCQIFSSLSSRFSPLTMSQLFSSYNVANHPQVSTGEKTEQEMLNRFLSVFDSERKGPDGVITLADFQKAHREISAAYPIDDQAFVRMMECVWGVREDVDSGDQEVVRVEVLVKEKIRLKMNSTDTESSALMKVFKFVDLDANGWVNPAEFNEAMRRIGLNLTHDQIRTFFRKYDLDGSGTLDYAEFARSIGNNNSHLFTKSTTHAFFS